MSTFSLGVGIDAGPSLGTRTGVGRYTQELIRALKLIGVDVVAYAVSMGGAPAGIRSWRLPERVVETLWRRFGVPPITKLTGPVDLVHATNGILPATGSAPGVVTVHDLAFLRDEKFPGHKRLRDLVPWSLRRAGAVVVPSRVVAHEVEERFRVPRAIMFVTPNGVAPEFFGATPLADAVLAAMGIARPFALALGTIDPRKNLHRLVEAWGRAGLDGWSLVLAGRAGGGPQLPAATGVIEVGRVADETLPGLLASAEFFCYPSLYEGFGLPPLEAMATGTAALVGSYSAGEEVLADAALKVDSEDVDDIARGLAILASDDGMRRRLSVAGRARAARYTWEGTAGATIQAYRSVIG